MKEIKLESFGPVISDKDIGEKIYQLIKKELESNDKVSINMNSIISMATYCAKQIFGRLYIELGPENFYDKLSFKNASDDIKIIMKIGIENSLRTKK